LTAELVVRVAEPSDVAAITTLVTAAYSPYVERINRQPAPMTDDYSIVVGAGHTWVAQYENRVVGVLVLRPADDYLLVDNVAVAPARQGLGVGSRLLALADDEARRLNLPELRLYTNQAMTENIDYYVRRGYRETHRADDGGFSRVYFSKLLNDLA
jgi:N-acetylglutamate synthase-like GNAT family acetyltransferase